MAVAYPPSQQDFLTFLCDDGKLPPEEGQSLKLGIDAPVQRQNDSFDRVAQDLSKSRWVLDKNNKTGRYIYPPVTDEKEEAPRNLQPCFQRKDKRYIEEHMAYSGKCSIDGAPGAVQTRVFTNFQGCTIVDQDTRERRKYLVTDEGWRKLFEITDWGHRYPAADGGSLKRWEHYGAVDTRVKAMDLKIAKDRNALLDFYFEYERSVFEAEFHGIVNDKQLGSMEMNFPFASNLSGITTTLNNSLDTVEADSFFRFLNPRPGHTFRHYGKENWGYAFNDNVKDKFDSTRTLQRLPAELYVIHDPNKEYYHGEVMHGGGPGEQLTILLRKEGRYVGRSTPMYK